MIDYNRLLATCNASMVYCIYKDRSNTFRIGTDNGIIKISGRSFYFTPLTCRLQGREQKDIRCRKIIADRDCVLYAGTESHGLLRLTNSGSGQYTMQQLSAFGAYPVSALPSYKMIADRLGITLETVRQHIKNIYRKLHVNSKGEVIARSIRGEI